MLPSKQALLEAAHACYASVYASEFEEQGGRFPAQEDICEHVPRLPDDVQLPIVMRYIGRIEHAWGHDLGLVFHHMDLGPDDEARALSSLMLGCMGHGVSIADDYGKQFDHACEILRIKTSHRAPIFFEGLEWFELAQEALTVSAEG
jgi:hypothetical protein